MFSERMEPSHQKLMTPNSHRVQSLTLRQGKVFTVLSYYVGVKVVVSLTLRPIYHTPILNFWKTGWAVEPVWTRRRTKNLCSRRLLNSGQPASSPVTILTELSWLYKGRNSLYRFLQLKLPSSAGPTRSHFIRSRHFPRTVLLFCKQSHILPFLSPTNATCYADVTLTIQTWLHTYLCTSQLIRRRHLHTSH